MRTTNRLLLCACAIGPAACGGDDEPTPAADIGVDTEVGADTSDDAPTGSELCFNATDDDGDGLTDCEDPDCAEDSACRTAEVCDNETDDNGDGLVDCDDPDCAGDLLCSCPASLIEGLGYVEGATVEGEASLFAGSCGGDAAPEATFGWTAPETGTYTIDTLDAGFDTVLYVLDGTCGATELACNDDLFSAELCSVEGDEDGNGLADCEDPRCATSHLCVEDAPEDCGNEEDDDGDGDIDCDDADCGFDPGCLWSTTVYQSLVTVDLEAGQEIVIVVDGFDADEHGDLFVNIANDRTAAEEVCDDDLDDDIDGLYDCADSDCADAPGCEECETEDLGSALGEVATGDTTEARRNHVGTCSGVGDPHMSGGRNARDVAYSWTAPGSGVYTFDTDASDRFGEEALDSVLYVREGDCAGRELACNDDIDAEAENYQSEVELTLVAGDAVTIIIDGWRYSSGQYVLTIDGPEGDPEPDPEMCDNEIDDDGDEAVDCDDEDCAEDEACAQ